MKLAAADGPSTSDAMPRWLDATPSAGAYLEGSGSPNYYGLATVDVDLDGCVDLLVAPMRSSGRTRSASKNFAIAVTASAPI